MKSLLIHTIASDGIQFRGEEGTIFSVVHTKKVWETREFIGAAGSVKHTIFDHWFDFGFDARDFGFFNYSMRGVVLTELRA